MEVTKLGGPEVLRVADRPDPEPGPGQVVVRVRAANVTRRTWGPGRAPDVSLPPIRRSCSAGMWPAR